MSKDYSILASNEWNFGNNRELAQKLKDFVLSGKKTATTGLYRKGDKVTVVGAYEVIVDSDKKPFCVIQITKSETKPFLEVGWEHAEQEGEDYRDLEDWRQQHRDFFMKEYGAFSDDSLVICDEFKVVQRMA